MRHGDRVSLWQVSTIEFDAFVYSLSVAPIDGDSVSSMEEIGQKLKTLLCVAARDGVRESGSGVEASTANSGDPGEDMWYRDAPENIWFSKVRSCPMKLKLGDTIRRLDLTYL